MSKKTSKPKSRKEHDQIKRGKIETASQDKPFSKEKLNKKPDQIKRGKIETASQDKPFSREKLKEKCSKLCKQGKNLLRLK
jgi:hypothetical protein